MRPHCFDVPTLWWRIRRVTPHCLATIEARDTAPVRIRQCAHTGAMSLFYEPDAHAHPYTHIRSAKIAFHAPNATATSTIDWPAMSWFNGRVAAPTTGVCAGDGGNGTSVQTTIYMCRFCVCNSLKLLNERGIWNPHFDNTVVIPCAWCEKAAHLSDGTRNFYVCRYGRFVMFNWVCRQIGRWWCIKEFAETRTIKTLLTNLVNYKSSGRFSSLNVYHIVPIF